MVKVMNMKKLIRVAIALIFLANCVVVDCQYNRQVPDQEALRPLATRLQQDDLLAQGAAKIPIGFEIEFFYNGGPDGLDSFIEMVDPQIPSELDVSDDDDILLEFSPDPTWSYRDQLDILRHIKSATRLQDDDVDSVQINIGACKEEWGIFGRDMRKQFMKDATWLMFNVVVAFVSDGRIERKKTRAVLSLRSDEAEPMDDEEYIRFEYAFGDIYNIDEIARVIQCLHACLFNYYYVQAAKGRSHVTVPPSHRALAAIGEQLRESLIRNDILREAKIMLTDSYSYAGLNRWRREHTEIVSKIRDMLRSTASDAEWAIYNPVSARDETAFQLIRKAGLALDKASDFKHDMGNRLMVMQYIAGEGVTKDFSLSLSDAIRRGMVRDFSGMAKAYLPPGKTYIDDKGHAANVLEACNHFLSELLKWKQGNSVDSILADMSAKAEGGLSAEAVVVIREHLETIERMIEGLKFVVETGEYPERHETIDVNNMILRLTTSLWSKGYGHNIDSVELEKGLPCIKADRVLFERAFLNIMSNAHQAANQSREPIVDVTTCFYRDGGEVEIRIRDNGPGIPEDIQPIIFERYFTTKGIFGTGLGLAIAKEIIEFYGGSINFETEAGRGTTFIIRLQAEENLIPQSADTRPVVENIITQAVVTAINSAA